MVAVHETAYPRLRSRTTFKDLEGSIWEPAPDELKWVKQVVTKPLHRHVLLIHLKMFQHLGYHVAFKDIPAGFIQYYGKKLRHRSTVESVRRDAHSSRRSFYIEQIRQHLGVRPFDTDLAEQAMAVSAETRHYQQDMINEVIELLLKDRCELPGFSTLNKMAVSARHEFNSNLYSSYWQKLSTESKKQLSELLEQEPWDRLKPINKKVSRNNASVHLNQLQWYQNIRKNLPNLPEMTPEKCRALELEACAQDRSEMESIKSEKQALLLALLLRYRHAQVLDDIASIFLKLLRSIHNRAQTKLQEWQKGKTKQQEKLIAQLKSVSQAYQQESTSSDPTLESIGQALKNKPQEVIKACNELLEYSDGNYLPFTIPSYRYHRSSLLTAMSLFTLRTACNDYRLIQAWHFIKKHQKSRKTWLDVSDTQISWDWIPARKWWKLVTGTDKKTKQIVKVHRLYLELCLLTLVAEGLQCADLFIENSTEFSDRRLQLISDEEYRDGEADYCDMVGFPADKVAFCQDLRQRLKAVCQKTDMAFPSNTQAKIKDGELVISPIRAEEKPAELEVLETLIQERTPSINILDLLTETKLWLNLSRHWRPLSGQQSRIDNLEERFVLALLCYGCNLGSAQLSRSVKGVSRKQIARMNLKYSSEEGLSQCIKEVINAYNKFSLPGYWGTGKSASADGTKWDLYENNLLSEYHVRYGGYGGIGYYHVSDTYIALFSRFIPCGVYEAIYILDALLENQSDIQPDTLHADTHGQSLAVFGLAHLLGIKLMPRIKNIKRLIFYRPETGLKIDNIGPLFRETLKWERIEACWEDMLRIAMSIKAGKISASTIIKRLNSKSRKNSVYYGFRELGRAVRTLFLLEYIQDTGMRRMINAATNKSEKFNDFSALLFFGNKGVIRENDRSQQDKIIKYNHLTANMVILHTVETLSRTLTELRKEGHEITDEMLSHLSPYRDHHINLLGDYRLDLKKKVRPLEFDIFPNKNKMVT
ncbi:MULTISPECIES: Tn3 family transposase [unclassified Endozoicomonas]|uniref:Tn3 family transposase n=1 Tax=Endozoicomonas TaxID=305899 RepID=UPI003BB7FAA6